MTHLIWALWFMPQRQGNYCKLEDSYLVSSRLSRVTKGDPSSIKKKKKNVFL